MEIEEQRRLALKGLSLSGIPWKDGTCVCMKLVAFLKLGFWIQNGHKTKYAILNSES